MNSRIYLLGEIQENKRGNYGVIITWGSDGQYDSFCDILTSPRFSDLTSRRTQHHPIIRGYIGVSSEYGEELAVRSQDLNSTNLPVTLSELDRMIVTEYAIIYGLNGQPLESAHQEIRVA